MGPEEAFRRPRTSDIRFYSARGRLVKTCTKLSNAVGLSTRSWRTESANALP